MSHKSDYLQFSISTAREAGDLLMRNHGKMQRLEWKLKTNFKTQVDDESDSLIRKRIQENYPNHSILSEEDKDKITGSQYKWVVDPLDGTIPYTFGICDHWGVCIALEKNKEIILGVIYAPARKEMYIAEKGAGAYCNGDKIKVIEEYNLNRCILGGGPGKENPEFKRVKQLDYERKLYGNNGVTIAINTGCASIPLAFVAKGKIHGCAFPSLEPWDMAAASIINKEAGAKVTNFKGVDWRLEDPSIIAANPFLHRKLIDLLR